MFRSGTRFGAGVAATILVSTLFVASNPPASTAAAPAAPIHVAGNFIGDERDEIFEYRRGTGADYLFADFSKDAGSVSYTPYSFTLNGIYAPFAGDFDGDGYDELFLFGGGTDPDYVWKFTGPTTITQKVVSQGSWYYTAVGDFTGDGAEDILWYGPGTAPDELWEYNPGSLDPTVHRKTINLSYGPPAAGNFTGDGGEDVILYGGGDNPDYLWDFDPGSVAHTSRAFGPVGSLFMMIPLDIHGDGWTDIFWYTPGTAPDELWTFTQDGVQKSRTQVARVYEPVAGNFFDDGHDDIFWFGASTSGIWDYHMTATGVARTVWSFGALNGSPARTSGSVSAGPDV